jgi:hypothetical protein
LGSLGESPQRPPPALASATILAQRLAERHMLRLGRARQPRRVRCQKRERMLGVAKGVDAHGAHVLAG